MTPVRTISLLSLALAGCLVGDEGSTESVQNTGPATTNSFGTAFTIGAGDTSGPFFQSLGTNGRSCVTCHVQDQGWTITPSAVLARFNATDGLDPIFRTNDGSVKPNADVSTVGARRNAFSMLLNRGLIRVGMPMPAGAEFTLVAVDDPYGYASAAELSLFRRPLPSTNLPFLSTVMWDGRENKFTNSADLHTFDLTAGLTQQAMDATMGHALATGTNPTDMANIVAFESGLFTSQIGDKVAGDLNAAGGGGNTTQQLQNTSFYIGINDPLGQNPKGTAFDPNAFHLFDNFATVTGSTAQANRQRQIYRGQQIFNTRPVSITGVGGLNDALGQPTINGFCTTCHDTPNVGDHSIAAPLNIGLTDASVRTSDMPLYTLKNNQTKQTIQTTDPGRALRTGKWADIGKFKGPILRGLAARAPYFHNGFAATLDAVVDFYNKRFGLGLSQQEHDDLVAFLAAL